MSFTNAVRHHEARIFWALTALAEMNDPDDGVIRSFTHRVWEELCIAARLIGLAALNGESVGQMDFLQGIFRRYRPAEGSQATAGINIWAVELPAQPPTHMLGIERLEGWWDDEDRWTNRPVPDLAVGHRPPEVPEGLAREIRELADIIENTQEHGNEIATGIAHGVTGFGSQYRAGEMVYRNMRPPPDADAPSSETDVGPPDADVPLSEPDND